MYLLNRNNFSLRRATFLFLIQLYLIRRDFIISSKLDRSENPKISSIIVNINEMCMFVMLCTSCKIPFGIEFLSILEIV